MVDYDTFNAVEIPVVVGFAPEGGAKVVNQVLAAHAVPESVANGHASKPRVAKRVFGVGKGPEVQTGEKRHLHTHEPVLNHRRSPILNEAK